MVVMRGKKPVAKIVAIAPLQNPRNGPKKK
jgi:hypothetical protein